MIHVVGNSHVMYFTGAPVPSDECACSQSGSISIKAFKAGLAGASIYGLDRPQSKTKAGEKILQFVQKEKPTNLVIVLGDVDFREHLVKRVVNDPSENFKLIMGKLYHYVAEKLIPEMTPGGKITLFEMVPFSETYYRAKMDESIANAALWFWAKSFNEEIRKLAALHGWSTLSLWDDTVSPDGFLRREFVLKDKEVHVNPSMVYPIVMKKLEEIYGSR